MQIDDIKNYIYYGNNDGKGQLDYAIIYGGDTDNGI